MLIFSPDIPNEWRKEIILDIKIDNEIFFFVLFSMKTSFKKPIFESEIPRSCWNAEANSKNWEILQDLSVINQTFYLNDCGIISQFFCHLICHSLSLVSSIFCFWSWFQDHRYCSWSCDPNVEILGKNDGWKIRQFSRGSCLLISWQNCRQRQTDFD